MINLNTNEDDNRQMELFMEESYLNHVILAQSSIRRFIARCYIHRYIRSKYEKVYDPKKRIYFYYNVQNDRSSWTKPILLLESDITIISPTYSLQEATLLIQKQIKRFLALLKVRILYKSTVTELYDESTGSAYYYSKKTGLSFWYLPLFMKGTLDHQYKILEKKILTSNDSKIPNYNKGNNSRNISKIVESDSEEDTNDDSSNDSDLSDNNLLKKRRMKRRFPR